MKLGCCTSRWLVLAVLALLETITHQIDHCSQLQDTCDTSTDEQALKTLATGMESRTARCNLQAHQVMPGDELQWYVTRTTTNDGIMVNTANVTKYNMIGLMLEVHNITSSDEGYYFCRTLRNGMLVPEPRAGVCLFVYTPARFQTCSGNEYTAQGGCSEIEQLTSQAGDSVDFNIALVHRSDANETCNNQRIETITLEKVSPTSTEQLAQCSNSECTMNPRVMNITRTSNDFVITVTLANLTEEDIGDYIATADIRKPTNNMRVCIYKNFTLDVTNPTSAAPSSTSQASILPSDGNTSPLSEDVVIVIGVVIAVLVLLLIGLGAFVAILLLWTYKHRQGEGESNHKIDDVYASIKDVVFRRGDRRKNRKSGVPLTEDGDSQRSSTYVEGGKMVLPDGLNSEINQV